MKNNSKKYLQAVLSKLGLSTSTVDVSEEILLKSARWACGNPDFSFIENQIAALQPVLETLKNQPATHWFQPIELTLANVFFPKTEKPSNSEVAQRLTELKKLCENPPENLLTALQFHASTLAVSATKKLADLPLFDFIKTTAAIAHCLENGKGKLRLAGGSISGIQSYLYDIVSKRAGKLLKGRSFYLQLLSDSLAERFLKTFELSDAHIVYSSGGGFYVLMPDNENVEADFEDFKSTVIKQIYERHSINLTCEFAMSNPFDENSDLIENLEEPFWRVWIENKNEGTVRTEKTDTPKIWDDLLQKLNDAKNQRLSHNSKLLQDLLGYVDEGGADDDENSKFTRDTVTNDQILRSEAEDFDEDGNLVHRFTNAQQYLGRNLRDAEFWIASKSRFHQDCFPDPLGYFHLLKDEVPKNLPADVRVQVLNNPQQASNFIFYGGNKIPVFEKDFTDSDGVFFEKDSPKTFDQLALGENLDRLGILRMDVDNLGKIFSKDIGSPASFARYAAVSRSLDWFFKGYLNTIHGEVCEASGQKFSERTVIIYSGGDDLFIVGRWLETLEMACRIREDFKKWSCDRLTISGGVAILPDKFPVMQGANLAGAMEKTAKGYCFDDGSKIPCKKDETGSRSKNAICFFPEPSKKALSENRLSEEAKRKYQNKEVYHFDGALHWQNEMPTVIELRDKLRGWLNDEDKRKRVDRSLLGKIDSHAESRKEQEKYCESPRWIWNMIYDLGRFALKFDEQARRAEDRKDLEMSREMRQLADAIRDLAKRATLEDFEFKQKKRAVPFLYLLQTAARWVELERRTLSND